MGLPTLGVPDRTSNEVARNTREIAQRICELIKVTQSGGSGGSTDLTATNALIQDIVDILSQQETVGFAVATNTVPVTIPDNAYSYSIVNLGQNAEGLFFADIALSGGLTATIPASLNPFSVSAEHGYINNSNVTVTPASGHSAAVTWII